MAPVPKTPQRYGGILESAAAWLDSKSKKGKSTGTGGEDGGEEGGVGERGATGGKGGSEAEGGESEGEGKKAEGGESEGEGKSAGEANRGDSLSTHAASDAEGAADGTAGPTTAEHSDVAVVGADSTPATEPSTSPSTGEPPHQAAAAVPPLLSPPKLTKLLSFGDHVWRVDHRFYLADSGET